MRQIEIGYCLQCWLTCLTVCTLIGFIANMINENSMAYDKKVVSIERHVHRFEIGEKAIQQSHDIKTMEP